MNRVWRGIGEGLVTLGPVGHLPIAPGTWGSLAMVVLWWVGLGSLKGWILFIIFASTTALGVWLCGIGEERWGKDAGVIVWDEMVGQMVALWGSPISLLHLGSAFILFRLLDVVKPFPIHQSQRLPRGWGVMADDIIAGGVAALMMWIIRKFTV